MTEFQSAKWTIVYLHKAKDYMASDGVIACDAGDACIFEDGDVDEVLAMIREKFPKCHFEKEPA